MKSGTTGNIIQWYVLFIWVSAMILGLLMFDGYGVFLNLGLLMMIAPLPLAFIFGRVDCGWLCPMGSILDRIISKISGEREMSSILQSNITRIILLILMPAFIIMLALKVGSVHVFGAVLGPILLGMMTMLMIAVIMGVLFRHRSWCTVCPVGTIFSGFSRMSKYDFVRTGDCVDCGKCKTVCPLHGKTWRDNKRAGQE